MSITTTTYAGPTRRDFPISLPAELDIVATVYIAAADGEFRWNIFFQVRGVDEFTVRKEVFEYSNRVPTWDAARLAGVIEIQDRLERLILNAHGSAETQRRIGGAIAALGGLLRSLRGKRQEEPMATATKPRKRTSGGPLLTPPDIVVGELDLRDDEPGKEVKTPARRGPAAKEANGRLAGATFSQEQVQRLEVSALGRHPANRKPTAEDVAARAASIETDGVMEKPVVRRLPPGHLCRLHGVEYQIISGETRVLALKKLGRTSTECRVIECSDAEALRLLADFNGQEQDLSPIDKARLIAALRKPETEGGAGLTLERAAKHVGLQSASGASNLERLLELPQVWQHRVAAGELEESYARCLLPAVKVPAALAIFDKSFQDRDANYEWQSRENLAEELARELPRHVRPITPGVTRTYGYDVLKTYDHFVQPVLFEVTPELRKQLDVIELAGDDGKPVEVARNTKLFDKLQNPLVRKAYAARQKSKAEKVGAAKPVAKKKNKPLTPAEQKAADKRRAGELEEAIKEWRRDWLRHLVAEQLSGKKLTSAGVALAKNRLLVWLVCQNIDPGSAFNMGTNKGRQGRPKLLAWPDVQKLASPAACTAWIDALLPPLVGNLDASDINGDDEASEVITELAATCEVDLDAEWERLATIKGGPERIDNFLLLHNAVELRDLARAWKLPETLYCLGEKDLRKQLAEQARNGLPMPTCLAMKEKRKAKKKAK